MNNNIKETLNLNHKIRGHVRLYIKYGIVLLLLVIFLFWWWWPGQSNNSLQFETEEISKGDLTVIVTATGILQPLNQVDVGTEISGTVVKIEVDFNDRVTAGQILARLDTKQLSAKLRQSQAALVLAKAMVKETEATVLETQNKLQRTIELVRKNLGTQELLDTAKATYQRAIASLERAKAQVTQAMAQLDADKTTLSKTEIRSPINGIVLKRQIEPGQTVAASLQTPILFTLAENLAQMELHVSVDEADVGLVKEGQHAVFKVDAFQQRVFPAKISQVRFAPQTVEGVVTYETVLSVNNEDLSLRPGMTATAEIIVHQLQNVLLVPNTALRFTPPKRPKKQKTNILNKLFSRRPSHDSPKTVTKVDKKEKQHQVWVLRESAPEKIKVKIGASDGQVTEITDGNLAVGMHVIIDTISVDK